MTTPDLDAIKARLAAATPGPWGLQGAQNDYELRGPGPRVDGWNTGPLVMEVSRWNKHPSPADVDLIEHAPADLAALVAEVERLRAHRELCTENLLRGYETGKAEERTSAVAYLRDNTCGCHDFAGDIERGAHRDLREEEP